MAVCASISNCAHGDGNVAREQASGTQERGAKTGREAKTRRKERKGRQVGEDDEDWRTGNKERTEEGLVVPADDHVPIGRDRTLPSHHGGQLSLVHATYPSDLHDRSIDASMAGWVDGSDGTDDGQADDGPLHRAVAECPRSRPVPFLQRP